MESKIKIVSEDENTIELESGITVVGFPDDILGCKDCCFADFLSEVCKQSLCVGIRRKDKVSTIFKLL